MSDVSQYQIAIGTLAAVVAVLFGYLRSVDARQEQKLNACEEDRRELWTTLARHGIQPPAPEGKRIRGSG